MQAGQNVATGDTLVALIVAITTLIGSVGGILAAILPKLQTTNKEPQEARDLAIKGAQAAMFASQAVAENKDDIKKVANAVIDLNPQQAKDYLEKHEAKQVEIKRKQVGRLRQVMPEIGQIDLIKDFPR